MLWAVGPEGSKAHQLVLKILEMEKLEISPLVTRGSLESLERIATGKALAATVRADHAALSYQGNNQQVRADATRVVSTFRPLLVYILVKKDLVEGDSLQSLPNGTTIITDPLWEGGSFIARQLLRVCGRNPDQFEFEEMIFSEWDETLQKENVLSAVLTASIGDERIKGILESGVFQLVSFPVDKMGILLENHPYFIPFKIQDGMYPQQSDHMQTVMLKNLLLVRVDYPPEKVQKFCPIPIHQGALRYFRTRCEFFTGDPLGTYYDLGIDLSSFFNRLLSPVILPRKSSGSIENINAIERLYGQLALVQSDIAYNALIEKTLTVPDAPHLRAVAAFAPENMHIIVRKRDGINTLSDLVGKKISLGELGSGTMLNAVEILKSAGIYPKLRKEDLFFLNRKQLLPALQQGTIDCFFQMCADPSDFLINIFRSGKYRFLSLPPVLTKRLVKTYPYYLSGTIPEGSYPHQYSSCITISTIALLVTHKDADSDLIKKIVTLLGEHIKELSTQHLLLKGISVSQLWTRSSIPFHEIVPSVVSQRGWPIKQPDVSLNMETEVNLSNPIDSSSTISKQEMKALIYPEEMVITEKEIDRERAVLEEGKERRFMSLQEANLLTLRENLSIAVEASPPLLRQLDVAIEKAQFYPHLLVNAERSVERENDIARTDETIVGAAIEEKLPSGATIKVGSDWITWDDEKTSRTYQFSSFFELTQPLLEGMGIEINLADYRISRESA
jgi:TRAP transporter TAXI family solute receptor